MRGCRSRRRRPPQRPRAAQPTKPIFAVGFLTGQEVAWLPRATRILSDELTNIEIRVSSGFSTTLADDLIRGKIDIAFLRREPNPDLVYKLVAKEPLVAILPSDHPLASNKAFNPRDLSGETFIGISEIPRILRGAVNRYLKRSGVEIAPRLEIDNFAMAISLVTSERGVALLPISIEDYLPPSIVSRPLKGEEPTVDLVVGYHRANASPILSMFLSRVRRLERTGAAQARQTTIKRAPGRGRSRSRAGRQCYIPRRANSRRDDRGEGVAGSQGDREPATCPQRRAGGGGDATGLRRCGRRR